MALQIPRGDLVRIVKIINLNDTSVEGLISALEMAPAIHDTDEIAKHISSSISFIPPDELTEILDILDLLYYIREFSNAELSDFVDDVIDGVRESPYAPVDIQKIERRLLKEKLEKLLNIKNLRLISKSARIQRDGERLYCESKILSDIRPVFDVDPSVKPVGAVITHTLKITYHTGRDRQEIHVVLDSDGLLALKEVIDRACKKEKTLQALMDDAQLKNLGL